MNCTSKGLKKVINVGVVGLGYGLDVQIPALLNATNINIIAISGASRDKAEKIAFSL